MHHQETFIMTAPQSATNACCCSLGSVGTCFVPLREQIMQEPHVSLTGQLPSLGQPELVYFFIAMPIAHVYRIL
jgi:hypothetical protein